MARTRPNPDLGLTGRGGAAAKPAAAMMGDSASPAALARLNQAVSELKAQALPPLLQRALLAMKANRHQEGAETALRALELDERCGLAWHILGICREQAGDFVSSLKCYETALALTPEDPVIGNDLGRLAYRMGMKDMAEQFFAHFLARNPGSPEGANNLACVLRDRLAFAEAVETLRPVIYANPETAMLWNTLGSIMNEQGEMAQAVTFFDEALRLEPRMAKARYNRGNAKLALGDLEGALADCEAAIPLADAASDLAMMRLARSTHLIAAGRIGEGWDAYEARLDPDFADTTHFAIDRPRWTPDADLGGKHLLLMGEQGLGDEVMFANMIPDVLAALGPEGKLSLALEPRLVPLFRRSFPKAETGAHATYNVDYRTVRFAPFVTDMGAVDLWAPMGSLLRRFRRTVDAFPDRPRFLSADPARVDYWRAALGALGAGPKVGLLWKSLKLDSGRSRHFSPFQQWRPVLEMSGVQFVNLQYGDCTVELQEAREKLGVEIWSPPDLNLKDALDEVAALSCALDLVIGPANATTNIAAACGAPVWLISTPGAWPKLGTDRYPWYPQIRVFNPPGYNRWAPVMSEVAQALTQIV